MKHLKEKKIMFLYWKFFSLTYRFQNIWKQLEAPFWNNWGQHISLRILIRIRIRKKNLWIRIHNTANTVHLIFLQQANYGGMWRWIWVGISQNFNEHLALDMRIMFDLCNVHTLLWQVKTSNSQIGITGHQNRAEHFRYKKW
jgi:hypothetical protein